MSLSLALPRPILSSFHLSTTSLPLSLPTTPPPHHPHTHAHTHTHTHTRAHTVLTYPRDAQHVNIILSRVQQHCPTLLTQAPVQNVGVVIPVKPRVHQTTLWGGWGPDGVVGR